MLRIKSILNDLVGYAYQGIPEELLKQYKAFYVEICDKERRSFHGQYDPEKRHIYIYNMYRSDQAIIVTTIHELAHHIDNVNRGWCSDAHGKPFYIVYRILLYTALDMGIFSKDEFLQATRDASDSNKVAKMLSEYIPRPIPYKQDKVLFVIKNGYEQKDFLKSNNFLYNHINKSWELEAEYEDKAEIENQLSDRHIKYELKKADSMTFNFKKGKKKRS